MYLMKVIPEIRRDTKLNTCIYAIIKYVLKNQQPGLIKRKRSSKGYRDKKPHMSLF